MTLHSSYWFGLLLACGMASVSLAHSELPGAKQTTPIVLENVTLHPVTSPPIANGKLLFQDGKIVALGTDIAAPDDALHVDLGGHHVYPGLFDSYSQLGLVEIEAVRATRDITETGSINPNVRAHVAVNPDSELIPVTRSNGVLLALTVPTGGLLSGQSAVLQLDGWTYEDMTLAAGAGMHVHWPRTPAVLGDEKANQDPLESLKNALDTARAYQRARTGPDQPIDVRWEGLLPVLAGQMPLIVSADDVQQIQSAVAFCEQEQLKLILYGGYDAPHCASLLVKHDVPVIIAGVYRLPLRRDDEYDAAYTLPQRLRQAGIRFCISASERFGASNVRNLPYHAATAAAYGLPRDEALKSITLYPAQIFGLANRVGSLEVGKDATLIVTTGDPLETASQVRKAYIQGREVQLNDRHKRLYRKYREKYRRLKDDAQQTAESP